MLINGDVRVVASRSHGLSTHRSLDRKFLRLERRTNETIRKTQELFLEHISQLEASHREENQDLRRMIVLLSAERNALLETVQAYQIREPALEERCVEAEAGRTAAERRTDEAEAQAAAARAKETEATQIAETARVAERNAEERAEAAEAEAAANLIRANKAEAKVLQESLKAQKAEEETARLREEKKNLSLELATEKKKKNDAEGIARGAGQSALQERQKLEQAERELAQLKQDLLSIVRSISSSLGSGNNIDVTETIRHIQVLKGEKIQLEQEKEDLAWSNTKLKIALAVATPLAAGGVLAGTGLAAPVMQGVAKTAAAVKNFCTAHKVATTGLAATVAVAGTAYIGNRAGDNPPVK